MEAVIRSRDEWGYYEKSKMSSTLSLRYASVLLHIFSFSKAIFKHHSSLEDKELFYRLRTENLSYK